MGKAAKSFLKYLPVFIVIILVSLLFLGLFAGRIIRNHRYQSVTQNLTDAARMLKSIISQHPPTDLDAFSKSAGTPDTRITILTIDGSIIGDSHTIPADLVNQSGMPEIQGALRGEVSSSVRFSESLDRDMMYLSLPPFDFEGGSIILRCATPSRSLYGAVTKAYSQIALAGVAALVFAGILFFIFLQRMNAPIAAISRSVDEYAAGNFDFRPSSGLAGELKRIADKIYETTCSLNRRFEQASKQHKELRTVVSSIVEAVVVLKGDMVIQDMNPAAYRLADPDIREARGNRLDQVFGSSDLLSFAEHTLTNPGMQKQEIIFYKDREIHLQARGEVVRTKMDRDIPDPPEGVVLVLYDITQLKELEKRERDFVAKVSSELKIPVTAIKGNLESLLEGDHENRDPGVELLSGISRHADRLESIIANLSYRSRFEKFERFERHERSESESELFMIDSITSAALRVCRSAAAEKNIDLELVCPAGINALVNPLLLEQAITNLVDNAIKYSNRGSRVETRVEKQNDEVVISVQDNGPGIPEEDLPGIFEKAYRVDPIGSRILGGNGLGLSIVKQIMNAQGGDVEIDTVMDQGSTFRLRFPAKKT